MLIFETKFKVKNLTGKEITDFLLNPEDAFYSQWWPDVHLQLHSEKNDINLAPETSSKKKYMDNRSYRLRGMVIRSVPGREIVWQAKKVVHFPIKLLLQLEDDDEGVHIVHTVKIGYRGIGSLLDPVLKSIFSKDFERKMETHIKTEFPKLRNLLRQDNPRDHA